MNIICCFQCPAPENGVYIHGIFMDGFRWSDELGVVADSLPGEMTSELPMVHMLPEMDFEPDEEDYISPMYKTSLRAGTLSTTGRTLTCLTINYNKIHL